MDKWKVLVFGGAGIFILILVIAFFVGRTPPVQKVTLEFWSAIDDKSIWEEVIANFNSQFPNITVNYTQKSASNFEKDLLEALAISKGPDILTIPNTWLPAHQNKLYPAPTEIISFQNLKDNFVDVASEDFSLDQKVYALPLFIDTLALYYNKDLFNKAGIAQLPTTWDDFLKYVALLTIHSETKDILQSGTALGTAENIEHSSDILQLLMLQNGTKMISFEQNKPKATFNKEIERDKSAKALTFYTQFAQVTGNLFTWNSRLPNSLDYFAQGKTAMIFDYSSAKNKILDKNAQLNFAVALMPQIKNASKYINYANYWGLAVTLQSTHPVEAWQFIKTVTETNNLYFYLQKSQKPSARRDLIPIQQQDAFLKTFASQALSAVSWYQVDKPAIDLIFQEMIKSTLEGKAMDDILNTAAKKINQLMEK